MEGKNRIVLLLSTVAVLAIFLVSCNNKVTTTGTTKAKGSAEVKGFIVLAKNAVRDDQGGATQGMPTTLHIPAVGVSLKNTRTGKQSSVITDLSGRFHFPEIAAGSYQLCWQKEGFQNDCQKAPVLVKNERRYLGEKAIQLEKSSGVIAYFGKVRFADKMSTRTVQPFFGVNAYSQVRSKNSDTYVNNFGWYVLPAVARDEQELEAKIETEVTRVNLLPVNSSIRIARKDIDLSNSVPSLLPITATQTASLDAPLLRTTKAGSKVILRANASDPDSDPLKISWRTGAAGGALSATTGDTVTWILPNTAGKYSVEALVADGRGGYKVGHLVIAVDSLIKFSGKVQDSSGSGIADADININGKLFKTLSGGRFVAQLEEANNYVVNINKKGFIPASRRYGDAVTDGRWSLGKTQLTSFVHKDGIDITQERRPQDCKGSPSERIKWDALLKQFGEQRVALRQHAVKFDKNGKVIRPVSKKDLPRFDSSVLNKEKRNCGAGARLKIKGNSLKFADGSALPANAIVDVELGTIDLDAPDAMPGDMSAVTVGGENRFLQSFGAAYVKLNSGGNEVRLAQRASIEIPIPTNRLTSGFSANSKIPVLSYNPEKVIWEPYLDNSNQQLMAKKVGASYVAEVDHFSTVNMDDYKVNPACIAIDAQAMPDVFTLEITVNSSGEVLTPVPSTVQNSPTTIHALYNLPPQEDVEIRIYDNNIVSLNGTTLDPGLLIGTYTTNTGTPYGLSLAELENQEALGYPACGTLISPDVVDMPVRLGDNAFLSLWPGQNQAFGSGGDVPFESNGVIAQNYLDMQADYYQKIDKCGDRTTLDLFRDKNGFVDAGNNEADDITRAVYANTVDLGFGREMSCRKSNCDSLTGECDVACYVSNYGQGGYLNGLNAPTPDNEDFLAAATGLQLHQFSVDNPGVSGVPDAGLIATVAMEYTRLDVQAADNSCSSEAGGERFTKFYVYGGDGGLVVNNGVNLDGFGERPVPQLCTVCHGGSLSGNDGSALSAPDKANEYFKLVNAGGTEFWMSIRLGNPGSQFLPFDLESFSFVDDGAVIVVEDTNNNGQIDGLTEFIPRTISSLGLDRNGQERAFYDLNKLVLRTVADEPNTHAIKEVIHKMYPQTISDQNAAFSVNQAVSFVVDDWAAAKAPHSAADNSKYYQEIVAKSCRTCHVSQASGIDWSSASGFYGHSTMNGIICDAPQIMPHAYATWEKFWNGVGGQPEFLRAFDAAYAACTDPLAGP